MLCNGKKDLNHEDFKSMVVSVLTMYNTITGAHFQATDESIDYLFQMLDKKKDGVIDREEYGESMQEYKHIFEWFDFMNKGIADQLNPAELERVAEKESYINTLTFIDENLRSTKDVLSGDASIEPMEEKG
jgi:Ca2+-binding EF-hand superfamily protein